MRIAARIIGGLLLVVAGLLLVGLGPNSASGPWQPLGALWYALSPGSLNLLQAVIERYIWAALWDPVLIGLLQWPAAAVFGGLGALLLGLGFLPRRAPTPQDEAPERETED